MMKNNLYRMAVMLAALTASSTASSGMSSSRTSDADEECDEITSVCRYLKCTPEQLYEKCKTNKKLLSRSANAILERKFGNKQ